MVNVIEVNKYPICYILPSVSESNGTMSARNSNVC